MPDECKLSIHYHTNLIFAHWYKITQRSHRYRKFLMQALHEHPIL